MKLLLLYLVIINLLGAGASAVDKWCARHDKRRIRERTLFLYGVLGGVPGVYLSMRLLHHKTLHKRFMWGLPALFILQIVITAVILYNWYKYFGFPVR